MLTILHEWTEPRRTGNGNRYLCKASCDCGDISTYEKHNIASGNSTRCKVCSIKIRADKIKVHGAALKNNKDPSLRKLYIAWQRIKSRCLSNSDKRYSDYGGRGISVCEEWISDFERFAKDMGLPPSRWHSIDRIDVNGNYCKENCRWATPKEQGRNKRNNHNITIDGETLPASEWAERSGVGYATLLKRLSYGWEPKDAVFGRIGKYVVDGVIYKSIPEIAKLLDMSTSGVHYRLNCESYPTWHKL